MLLLWSALLIASLAVLVRSAGAFISGAEEIGVRLGMPAFAVGVTIVSVGTTLPEMVASVVAVTSGSPEIPLGNVVGSIVTNVFLVLGVAAVVGGRLHTTYEIVRVDLPLLVGSAFVLAIVAYDGSVTRPEALVCLVGSVIYVMYGIAMARRREGLYERLEEEIEAEVGTGPLRARAFILLGLSALGLYLGASYTVRSVVELAGILGIGSEIIALSVVALGTSLPELTVAVLASRRGNLELAIGNVLGACILNAFAVVGVAGLVGPLASAEAIRLFGLPMMLVAALLYFFMAEDREITRWEGWLLVLMYALYVVKLFGWA